MGGKPYSGQGQGDTQSIVTSRPKLAERVYCVLVKKGDVPLDRVWSVGVVLSVRNRGIIWRESVLNRVYNFVQVCPLFFTRHNFKRGLRFT